MAIKISRLLQGVFFAYMLFIVPSAVMYMLWRHSLILPLFIIPVGLLGVYFYRRRDRFVVWRGRIFIWLSKPVMRRNTVIIIAGMMAVQAVLQVLFISELKILPLVDRGFIYDTAVSVAGSDSWHVTDEVRNAYFLTYGNNIPMLVIATAFFKLLKLFRVDPGAYYDCYILLNLFIIDLSVFLAGMLAGRRYGDRARVLFHGICLAAAPLYLFCVYVYTDSFAMLGVSGAALCYDGLLERCSGSRIKTLAYSGAGALCLAFGSQMKVTAAIFLIAACIQLGLMKKLKLAALFCGLFAIFMTGMSIGIDAIGMIDKTEEDRFAFPYIHWVMLGLSEDQTDGTDPVYTASFPGRDAKTRADLDVIKQRLSERGAMGTIWFLARKAAYTWGDGEFTMQSYFSDKGLVKSTPWQAWFWEKSDSIQYHLQGLLADLHYITLLAFMALSLYRGVLIGDMGQSFTWKLSLAGLGLFLLFWESSSRYLFQFYMLLLLAAMDGIITPGKPRVTDGVGRDDVLDGVVTGTSGDTC